MRQIVTTPGTPVQLANDATVYSRIIIQCLYANTDYIALDKTSTVRARDGEQNALLLKGGTLLQFREYTDSRLCDIWMDSRVANEGVAFEVTP